MVGETYLGRMFQEEADLTVLQDTAQETCTAYCVLRVPTAKATKP